MVFIPFAWNAKKDFKRMKRKYQKAKPLSKSIVLVGTLDTKGYEIDYVRRRIEELGCHVKVIDVGVLGKALVDVDYPRGYVAELGGENLKELTKSARLGSDRAEATAVMIKGVTKIVKNMFSRGDIDGIISLGGSTGFTIGLAAAKSLPIGTPKLMVTTKMEYAHQVGEEDITIMQTPADIMGLNIVMRRSLSQAASAIAGMVKAPVEELNSDLTPMVGITALGVTTPAVTQIRAKLEDRGYETIVFHNRTRVLEELIETGAIDGVIDLSLNELISAFITKSLPERRSRLDILGSISIPLLMVPGGFDMIILSHIKGNIPKKYSGRVKSMHGPYVTLVRTNLREIRKLAKIIVKKANEAKGPVVIMIPLKGFSSVDKEGQAFYDPNLIKVFTEIVRSNTKKHVNVIEVESHINDGKFANKACRVFATMKRVREVP
jgi:uncharacterized protein (UPF0261 family)